MNNDYLDPRNAEGMPALADSLFALDFLMSAKMGVRNCAFALAECTSPDARMVVHQQLENELLMHEEISQLMIQKGWLHPYHVNDQFRMDLKSAQTVLQIANLQLYPEETNRLGTFATPEK